MKTALRIITRMLPAYGVFPLVFSFIFNCLVYSGSRMIAGGWYHHNIETGLDRRLPFVPQFLIVYFGCYLFWAVNYIMAGHLEIKEFYRFVTADLLSRVVCGIFFVVLPTTNVRPELPTDSIFYPAMQWLWNTDQAVNLFPSIHCLVSWFCYIAIRGNKKFPRWYRWFSCIFAIAVFISTQTTKQHYLVDVIGAVALAEGCWWFSHHTSLYRYVMRFFDKINKKI